MDEENLKNIIIGELNKTLSKDYTAEANASLYYSLTINNLLEIEQNPKNPGSETSSFGVDILISKLTKETLVPRELVVPKIVIELEGTLSAQGVAAHSYKASKIKEVYPYLRCGLVIYDEECIPARFFSHGHGIDFVLIVDPDRVTDPLFIKDITKQISIEEKFENYLFGDEEATFYSMEPFFRHSVFI